MKTVLLLLSLMDMNVRVCPIERRGRIIPLRLGVISSINLSLLIKVFSKRVDRYASDYRTGF